MSYKILPCMALTLILAAVSTAAADYGVWAG